MPPAGVRVPSRGVFTRTAVGVSRRIAPYLREWPRHWGDARATRIDASGVLPQNVNYAVKTPYLQALLASAPDSRRIKSLESGEGSLEELGARVEDSVMIVVAK